LSKCVSNGINADVQQNQPASI